VGIFFFCSFGPPRQDSYKSFGNLLFSETETTAAVVVEEEFLEKILGDFGVFLLNKNTRSLLACLFVCFSMGGDSSSSSGSGSDDGGGRGHEWEVVSLSLSSHSLSASTSLDAGTGQGGNGVDTFATALHSGYFLCSPRSSSSPEAAGHESLSNKNGEERPSITEPDPDDAEEKKKKTEETASERSDVGLSEEASPATQDTDEMEEEHDGGTRRRRDALLPVVARSCASQMQQPELSGMEWLTPMTTAGPQTLIFLLSHSWSPLNPTFAS
jgi:hypothetical protein